MASLQDASKKYASCKIDFAHITCACIGKNILVKEWIHGIIDIFKNNEIFHFSLNVNENASEHS